MTLKFAEHKWYKKDFIYKDKEIGIEKSLLVPVPWPSACLLYLHHFLVEIFFDVRYNIAFRLPIIFVCTYPSNQVL